MMTLYGSPNTRAFVALWVAEELGLKYRHEGHDALSAPTRTAEFRMLSPTGKLPVLVDGPLVLTETLAICWHLVRQYGRGRLIGEGPAQEAEVMKWASFAMTELDAYAFQLLLAVKFWDKAPQSRDCENLRGLILRSLKVLENDLQDRDWLVGDAFGLADILVCHGVNFAKMMGLDLEGFPAVMAWRQRCLSRPACQKVRA